MNYYTITPSFSTVTSTTSSSGKIQKIIFDFYSNIYKKPLGRNCLFILNMDGNLMTYQLLYILLMIRKGRQTHTIKKTFYSSCLFNLNHEQTRFNYMQ